MADPKISGGKMHAVSNNLATFFFAPRASRRLVGGCIPPASFSHVCFLSILERRKKFFMAGGD